MASWKDLFVGNQPGLSEDDRTQLARGGLLQAGLQALAANNSRQGTPGEALAGGLLGGIQSAQQGGQQLVQDRYKQQQMQFQQSQMADQQDQMQRRRQIQDLALKFAKPDGSFDMPGYQQALAQIDPQAAMELHQNELRGQLVGLQTQKAQRDLNTAPTREVNSGDNILTQEQGADGSWKTIATAPRWNPKQMGLGGAGGGVGHLGPGAFQLIQGQDGQYYNVNKVTGEVTPVQAGGTGVVGSNTFRNQTQQVKNADSIAQAQGGIQQYQQAIDKGEALKNNPGIAEGTGLTGLITRNIPGTDAYAFGRDLDSYKASQFLPAVQALKGMGALTEVEGQKATDSIAAIDPKMSKADVQKRIDEANTILRRGLERAQKKAAMVQQATGVQPARQGGMSAADALAKYGAK